MGLITTPSMALLLAVGLGSPSSAQSISDILVCTDETRTVSEIAETLASLSWQRQNERLRIVELNSSAIFLGNVDGRKPDDWTQTYEWAESLAQAVERPNAIFMQSEGNAIEIGLNSANQRYCLANSRTSIFDSLAQLFPGTTTVQNGHRRWRAYQTDQLKILASEFPEEHRPNHLLPRNVIFTATIITNPNEVHK